MQNKFSIGKKMIGANCPCFIIAEAGVNHNGDVSVALALVDEAKKAGADAVKFQAFAPEEMASAGAKKAKYQKENTGEGGSQLEMLKKLKLSEKDFKAIKEKCDEIGIIFLCSPFDLKSAKMLKKMGVPAWKIASGEITNFQLIKFCAETKKPLIISTGMAQGGEIRNALEFAKKCGAQKLAVLHCTTNYPAQPKSLNLRAIGGLQKEFGAPVGFSDHSRGIVAPILSVAMGAKIIEKHFTLSRKMRGPDHRASLEPQELMAMAEGIRRAEGEIALMGADAWIEKLGEKKIVQEMLGKEIREPNKMENENKALVRKSLFAAKGLKKGQKITGNDLKPMRPLIGIGAERFYDVVGKTLLRDVGAGKPIKEKDLK